LRQGLSVKPKGTGPGGKGPPPVWAERPSGAQRRRERLGGLRRRRKKPRR